MIELKSETQQMVDKANASIISEQRERIAELAKERDKYKAHYDLAIEKEYPKKKFPRAYAQAKELKEQG